MLPRIIYQQCVHYTTLFETLVSVSPVHLHLPTLTVDALWFNQINRALSDTFKTRFYAP